VLKFLADENFHGAILQGLLHRNPQIDVVRAQDIGLTGADDPALLARAAAEGRILLTHDVATVTAFAYDRVRAGLPMPGVFEVNLDASMSRLLDDLLILAECSLEGEWEGQVRYLPL